MTGVGGRVGGRVGDRAGASVGRAVGDPETGAGVVARPVAPSQKSQAFRLAIRPSTSPSQLSSPKSLLSTSLTRVVPTAALTALAISCSSFHLQAKAGTNRGIVTCRENAEERERTGGSLGGARKSARGCVRRV